MYGYFCIGEVGRSVIGLIQMDENTPDGGLDGIPAHSIEMGPHATRLQLIHSLYLPIFGSRHRPHPHVILIAVMRPKSFTFWSLVQLTTSKKTH
jgi:hypothetical protein